MKQATPRAEQKCLWSTVLRNILVSGWTDKTQSEKEFPAELVFECATHSQTDSVPRYPSQTGSSACWKDRVRPLPWAARNDGDGTRGYFLHFGPIFGDPTPLEIRQGHAPG
jgi:hypothetical protein